MLCQADCLAGDGEQSFGFGIADHRSHEAAIDGHRKTQVYTVETLDALSAVMNVGVRYLHQGQCCSAHDEVIERQLFLAGREMTIHLVADSHQRVHAEIDRQIKMRHCLLGFNQTAGDGLAHRRHRHQLEILKGRRTPSHAL
ncbi:hypothetical protein D3C78_955560 [compost metagenome]